jgi:hypothetical protein
VWGVISELRERNAQEEAQRKRTHMTPEEEAALQAQRLLDMAVVDDSD